MTRQGASNVTRKGSVWLAALALAALGLLAARHTAAAGPVWHFPFSYGDTWRVSCAYGCYYHQNAAYYGLDFNWGSGRNADCGRSVLSVANGYVTRSSCSDSLANSGYGCYVEVWHAGGQRSLYAHLQRGSGISRRSGVCRGFRIGRVGDDGIGASSCHLHFHMTKGGGAYKPEPMYGRRVGHGTCRNLTKLRAETFVSCTGWGCDNPQ